MIKPMDRVDYRGQYRGLTYCVRACAGGAA